MLVRGRIVKMIHQKCTQGVYPSSNVARFAVPVEKIPWNIEFAEYKPAEYTSTVVNGKTWADPDISDETFQPRWNSVDGERFVCSRESPSLSLIMQQNALNDNVWSCFHGRDFALRGLTIAMKIMSLSAYGCISH